MVQGKGQVSHICIRINAHGKTVSVHWNEVGVERGVVEWRENALTTWPRWRQLIPALTGILSKIINDGCEVT